MSSDLVSPSHSQPTHRERNMNMDTNINVTKNIGMLLLGIWLVVSGLAAIVPAVFFDGLRVIMAILAVIAGIFILLRR